MQCNSEHAIFCLNVNKTEIFFTVIDVPLVHCLIIFWEMPEAFSKREKILGWIKITC